MGNLIGYLILIKQDADFAQPSQPTVCNATKKDGTDKTADEDKVSNIIPKQVPSRGTKFGIFL